MVCCDYQVELLSVDTGPRLLYSWDVGESAARKNVH